MQHMIIASTSTIHKGKFLEYLLDALQLLFKNVDSIVFIPYARPSGISYDEYTSKVKDVFSEINIDVKGLHEFDNPKEALEKAAGIFTGGGNTFLLVDQLYRQNLLPSLKRTITNGVPFLGTSAGSNICGLTMSTTNDMPIVQPKSFKTLGILPFNINPHYLEPDPNSTHMGETRDMRIAEFHRYNTQPVVGLREGSWLEVKDQTIILKGQLDARIFEHDRVPYDIVPGTDLSHLK